MKETNKIPATKAEWMALVPDHLTQMVDGVKQPTELGVIHLCTIMEQMDPEAAKIYRETRYVVQAECAKMREESPSLDAVLNRMYEGLRKCFIEFPDETYVDHELILSLLPVEQDSSEFLKAALVAARTGDVKRLLYRRLKMLKQRDANNSTSVE